jgi:outer membrane protein assembly factor BamD (BamD/ComL family)
MLRSAEAALASFNGIRFDDAPLIESEERYRNYLASYPRDADQEGVGLVLGRIYAQRAAKELDIARYYERAGHQRAAAFYYQSTVDNWPDTIAAVEAEQRLTRLDLQAGSRETGTADPAATSDDTAPPMYREVSP